MGFIDKPVERDSSKEHSYHDVWKELIDLGESREFHGWGT